MCRSQPPFYEKDINGVCVQVRPDVKSAGILDGLPVILILSIFGFIIYSLNKK
jgi:hypothetical protein